MTDFGPSKERTIIDKFLNDCRNSEIDIKLFGDWKVDNQDQLKLITPGIFTIEQCKILIDIQQGTLSADALDALIINSDHRCFIKSEQFKSAMNVMPNEPMLALLELMNIRKEKHKNMNKTNDTDNATFELIKLLRDERARHDEFSTKTFDLMNRLVDEQKKAMIEIMRLIAASAPALIQEIMKKAENKQASSKAKK